MDDDQDNRPKPKLRWYNHLSLPNPRWFPAWLGVCVFVGAALSGACWLAMDRLGGQALAGFFAGGFVLCLVVLSFTALNAEETEKQMGSLTPPPWLSVSIVLGAAALALCEWVAGLLAEQPDVPRPGYAIWLLLGCTGWFGLRLLWISADMAGTLWNDRQMSRQSLVGLTISILAGAAGGFGLVMFLWPERQGLNVAVPAGLVAGALLDILLLLGNQWLMQWLLARRLPHFQMLLRAEDAGQRAGAAATISRMGSHAAAAVPDLIEAVKDESAEVRTQAALALWASGVKEPALLTTLQALLHDGEERVRLVAAGALADYRAATPAEVLPVLMAGLMHPEDQFAGDIAAGRLGWLGLEAAPAAPALRAALFERQPPCKAALAVLDSIGEAGLPILADLLTHPDRSFRCTAATRLGQRHREVRFALGVQEGSTAAAVVPALQAACADEDAAVSRAAASALKNIQGN